MELGAAFPLIAMRPGSCTRLCHRLRSHPAGRPSEAAAVNLAVAAVLTRLERPGSTLADVTRDCHQASVDEVRSRYGWGPKAQADAPETGSLTCPRYGAGGVELKPRQWAVCSAPACTWGGMEFELIGYEDWARAT